MPMLLDRRQLMLTAAGAAGAAAFSGLREAFGQTRVPITEGNFAPLPIAIPNFVPGTPADTEVATGVAQVITNNLNVALLLYKYPRIEVIVAGGEGERFFHRTGHGIGLEEHEDPYIVAGNRTKLEPGHAFSIEPGIYLEGTNGARIEDIVICTAGGVEQLNTTSRELYVVEG